MRVILREAPHAHDAVKRARRFISVTTPKFRHTQRQVPIGLHTLIKDLNMGRAIHRFERMYFLMTAMTNFTHEHIFAKFIPMS